MNEMKITFIGVARRHGTSAKNGNAYDICELFHAWPLEPKRTDNYRYEVVGHEQRVLRLSPSAIDQFEDVDLGQEISVQLGPDPQNPMRNICVGIA